MGFWKNYGFTLALLAGVAVGAVCGMVWGEGTAVVRPVGDLFLDVVFVLIVPLVAFSMSSAAVKVCRSGMAWRLLGTTLGVFLLMSVVAALLTYVLVMVWNPFQAADPETFLAGLGPEGGGGGRPSLKAAVAASLLPLIGVSVVAGILVALLGERGRCVAVFLDRASALTVRVMQFVMYAAPVCLGCYFAWTVGSLGSTILGGYADAVLVYVVAGLVVFFLVNSGWVALCGGRSRVGRYWRGIVPPSLMAVATSSSAVCLPLNMAAATGMGVRPLISDSVIPLGTNIHKDGSTMVGVVKVVFLLSVFGAAAPSWGDLFQVVGVALLVGTVMGAVPTGGMTGELLVCTLFGYAPEMAAILMVFSTLIDIPATLLNVAGNVVAAVVVDRWTLPGGPGVRSTGCSAR
ncbi:MAG: cation:dicarboxylase symporter family transporter [Bacteroidales bacterium]|nr:cation:dicarboxylase symporter family transporter [Bacteroidales bacterium]